MEDQISIFKKNFWDLWVMKVFRNLASMKFQLLIMLYVLIFYGMFKLKADGTPFISDTVGLGFLGGGFLTLVTARIVANTSLTSSNKDLDTDK